MTKRQELEARIEAANKAAMELAAARDSEIDELLLQAEKAEKYLADDIAIDKLRPELGIEGRDYKIVETDLGKIAVARSGSLKFQRYMDAGKSTATAVRTLVNPCVKYPNMDGFEALLETQPFILMLVADAVSELAGVRADKISPK